MSLNLSDRPHPLYRPRSRMATAARFALSLLIVVLLSAAALYVVVGVQELREPDRPAAFERAGNPYPPLPAAMGPQATRFLARQATEVYHDADLGSAVVGHIEAGQQAAVLHSEGRWVLVDAPQGPGWVYLGTREWQPPAGLRVPTPRTIDLGTVHDPWQPPEWAQVPGASAPAGEAGPAAAAPRGPAPTPLTQAQARARDIERHRAESPGITWAHETLTRRGMQRLESEHFRLWTDVDDPGRLGLLLGLAEQTRRRFDATFEPHFRLEPLAGQSEVFLFRTRADYLEFYRRFAAIGPVVTNPSGHYSIDLRTIALSQEGASGSSTAATLVHEMVHLLLDQSLYGSEGQPAPWIGEGLASAFAYTTGSAEGRIALVQDRADRAGVGRPAKARLDALQRDFKNGLAPSLQQVLRGSQEDYSGARGARLYDASWLLCHFLLYADEGRHRPLLIAAISADRRQVGVDESLQPILKLEPAWRQYLTRLTRR
jgi:hypothetical protein